MDDGAAEGGGTWPASRVRGLRVAPLIGADRPGLEEDLGERFLYELLATRVSIACLLVHPDDRLIGLARGLGLDVLALPAELCTTRERILEALACPQFRRRLEVWLERFRALDPDLGFVFYGWWVPPELYRVPVYRMINFHPAPLPQSRGFEPDTAAVLRGAPSTCGTIHVVESGLDTGDILWQTDALELTPWETPPSVLQKVTRSALGELDRFFEAAEEGRIRPRQQDSAHAGSVDLCRLVPESEIDWLADNHAAIDRRNRAFNGQPWRVRLRARIGSMLCCIQRIATRHGDFPGAVGTVIGRYPDDMEEGARDAPFSGAALVRTCEGVAACVIAHECSAAGEGCLESGRCVARNTEVVPPGPPAAVLMDARLQRGLWK